MTMMMIPQTRISTTTSGSGGSSIMKSSAASPLRIIGSTTTPTIILRQEQEDDDDSFLRRGKKATIQLVDPHEQQDHEDHEDDDDDEEETLPTTASYSSSSSACPSKSQEQLKIPRVRGSVLERIVSNPIVSFLTCGGGGGGDGKQQQQQQQQQNQQRSCSFFSFRGSSSTTRRQISQFSFATSGSYPKAIVQTMKQFPYQGRIQRLGCGALRDLAIDSWPMKSQIVLAGSVETILKAMRIHGKDDAKLQEIACACLYELVAGDIPAVLVEKGVVEAVLEAMDQHAQDEDVLPVACNVLLALTDRDVGAVECLRQRLGGVVLAKLEHFFRGRNSEITQKVGELLRRLYL